MTGETRKLLTEQAQSILAALSLDEGHTAADIVSSTGLSVETVDLTLKELRTRRLIHIEDNPAIDRRYKLTVRAVNLMKGRRAPESERMVISRQDRHALSVALMIAIDNASRFADAEDQSPEGIKIREDYPRQWRQLLDRFSG